MTTPYNKYLETALLNRDRLNEALTFINNVFSEPDYNITDRVTLDDIEFTYHFLTNRHYVEKTDEEAVVVKKYRRLTELFLTFIIQEQRVQSFTIIPY
jgi:hypothetical protein